MPKKKAKKEKKNKEKKEILNELAEKLKETKDEELSNEAGNKEDINSDSLDFNQFIQPVELENKGTPVLERIAGFQPGPVFVNQIPGAPQVIPGEEKKKSEETTYVPRQEENNEPKYAEPSSKLFREPERVDFAQVGKEQTEIVSQANQETFFMHSEQGSQREATESERWKAEQISIERAGRKDPFKREETKYEKYKPKLPKGY